MTLTPMQIAIATALGKLGMLKYFPADEHTRASIGQEIASMATEPTQVLWLADAMVRHFNEWPGPLALRAAFSQRWTPADGVSADMQGFGGTWEAEIEQRALTAHYERKYLGAGESRALLPEPRVMKTAGDERREVQDRRWAEVCKQMPALQRTAKRMCIEFATTDDLDLREEVLRKLEATVAKQLVAAGRGD
jgi:hypothetical protein